MAKSEVLLEQLRLRIHEYCEWMGQRSFIYPNWLDSREEFLNENWGLYLDFTLAAVDFTQPGLLHPFLNCSRAASRLISRPALILEFHVEVEVLDSKS